MDSSENCLDITSPKDAKSQLILVVDDDEDNLVLLAQLLVLNEHTFITAQNGETALKMVYKYKPSLILLDMMLPDLSGIDVVLRLKEDPKTTAIPIIAVTAMARAEDRNRFLTAGCVDYIIKPYVIEEMENIVNRYLNQEKDA